MDKKISQRYIVFAALKEAGIKQKEIAARCKVSSSAVSQVINGRASSQRIRDAIAEAVNIPVDDLFP